MYNIMAELSNWIGYIGVLMALYAFYLSQANKINHEKYTYSLMNFVGSLLILYSLCFHLNLPSLFIEVAWLLISLYGVGKVYYRRKLRQA